MTWRSEHGHRKPYWQSICLGELFVRTTATLGEEEDTGKNCDIGQGGHKFRRTTRPKTNCSDPTTRASIRTTNR